MLQGKGDPRRSTQSTSTYSPPILVARRFNRSKSEIDVNMDVKEVSSTVESRLMDMLDKNKWTDIKFIVGEKPNDQVFEAHRNIISAASPVFEAMCFGELAEKKKSIVIPDITPAAFKVVLQYMYTNNCSLDSVETACSVMYAAAKYLLKNLTAKCNQYLTVNIRTDNVLYVLEHCHTFGMVDFKIVPKCMEHVHAALLRPEFVYASKETVVIIVSQETLNIPSEVVLLDACVRWAEERCKENDLVANSTNLRSVLGVIVSMIRFQTITAQELARSPGFNKLLTHEEAYQVLANVLVPGTFPVPPGFSISCKKRAIREADTGPLKFGEKVGSPSTNAFPAPAKPPSSIEQQFVFNSIRK